MLQDCLRLFEACPEQLQLLAKAVKRLHADVQIPVIGKGRDDLPVKVVPGRQVRSIHRGIVGAGDICRKAQRSAMKEALGRFRCQKPDEQTRRFLLFGEPIDGNACSQQQGFGCQAIGQRCNVVLEREILQQLEAVVAGHDHACLLFA